MRLLPCFLLMGALVGCRDEAPRPTMTAEVAPSAALPSATPSIAAPPPPAGVPTIAQRKIAGKVFPDGSLIGDFTIQRDAGDEGLVWLAAADHCAAAGLHLCTSTQWQVACEADPAIAAIETWTLTPEKQEGFVVRGGSELGCKGRTVSLGVQSSPFRAAACCSSALVAAARGLSPPMLRAMAKSVLDFERALNARRASALRGFLDDRVRVFTAEKSLDEALGIFEVEFRKSDDYNAIHELCDFSAEAGAATYTGDCRKIVRHEGKVAHVLTRYVFVGGVGKVRSMTDPQFYRPFIEP